MTGAVVYFARIGDDGPVKIGHSRYAERRIEAIQKWTPIEIRLIRTLPGDGKEERWLHARFDHLRIRGEWFHFDPRMMTITPPQMPEFDFRAYRRARADALSLSKQERVS
jgi:hypothetical protein